MDDLINGPETTNGRTVRELQELIAAVDGRLPRVRRVGEMSIARVAAQLRAAPVRRIEELEEDRSSDNGRDDVSHERLTICQAAVLFPWRHMTGRAA
jgi:hypothetical protein